MFSNDKLTNLGDFPVLQSIGGNFWVSSNDSLTDLGDFPALQTIGEYFKVDDNRNFTALGDFPALQTIGGYFSVDALTDLGDFPALQTIGGYFRVTYTALTDLGDFSMLMSIGVGRVYVPSERQTIDNVSIVVESNSRLSDCYTLTNFLPGGDHAVSGEIYINNNALGCNSGDQIMADPHTIMLTSHTDGDSIAIAYNEVTAQTITFTVGGASGWASTITGDDFITMDPVMNVADTGVTITVRATPTGENTGVERSATITLTTTGIGMPASVSLTITQGARADTTTLPPTDTTTTTLPPADTTTILYSHTGVDFSLYPNPTKGKLTVEGVTGYLQIYIHDLVGREVMTYSLTPSKKTLDVSNLPSGMYVVTVQGEDKTWTEVLIIVN